MPVRSTAPLAGRKLMRRAPLAAALALLLAGCAAPPARVLPAAPPPPSALQLLAAIHAAGAQDHSVLQIQPLRPPAVRDLQQRAATAQQAGDYAQAAALLDRALQLQPGAPDLLQRRAALALVLGDAAQAQRLARQAIAHGPQVGALCARSWQTLAEAARVLGDAAQHDAALAHVTACREPIPPGE